MTTDTTEQIMALAEALAITPGEKALPMATTDADEVIRSQLTENTGSHFLDSGGAYGRHHEENSENPPWNKPAFEVYDSFVVKNVYNHMDQTLDRDRTAVALEIALYAFGYSDEYANTSWLATMEAFVDALHEPHTVFDWEEQYDLPPAVADDVVGYSADLTSDSKPFTFNTYNGEFGAISQELQATGVNDSPYADYWLVQVHQGCDVRGGYTAPRVYNAEYGHPMTSEFSYYCESCGWSNAESCVYDHEDLYHFTGTVDGWDFEDAGLIDEDDESEIPVLEEVWDADHIDGAIIHDCQGTDRFGHVHP